VVAKRPGYAISVAAPRSIWNGAVTFGLVNVPIKVHSATESKTVRFREVHEKDGARLEHRRICPKDEKEVPYEHVVKGYEVGSDEYVILSDDEIEAAAGAKSKQVEVEEFVPREDIDPVFFDRTYYLGAGKGGGDAYRLLHAAIEKTDRVAIGRWIFHNRERLVAIRCLDDVLAMHTLRFSEELVKPKDLDVPSGGRKPRKNEVEMASSLLDSLAADFDPGRYRDTYREAVLKVVKRKAAGKDVEAPEREEPEEAPDLMAALEASVKKPGGKKKRAGGKRKKAKARS
jgi:DNA end-binding protein Ku